MGKRIVVQSIKRMKPPEKSSLIEWDAEIPGFGVRITVVGVTSFILDYCIFGLQRHHTIGRYPQRIAARVLGSPKAWTELPIRTLTRAS
jgi:hypothetical protein